MGPNKWKGEGREAKKVVLCPVMPYPMCLFLKLGAEYWNRKPYKIDGKKSKK